MPYAEFWRRAVAVIIDGVLLQIASSILHLQPSLQTLLFLVYFVGMESSVKQATLGKMAMSIKVTDLSGNRMQIGHAIARSLLKILPSFLIAMIVGAGFFVTLFAGAAAGGGTQSVAAMSTAMLFFVLLAAAIYLVIYLPAIFSKKKQALYDMIAKTLVLKV